MGQRSFLLSPLGGLIVIACGIYCIIWFKPAETSFLNPDVAMTCWLYCSTLEPFWGIVTLVSGALPILGGVLIKVGARRLGGLVAIISGIAILPAGLLPIVGGYLALREESAKSQRRNLAEEVGR